ncbi:hypothetical protein ACP4OV_017928 [Aristida adscensionis]
MDLPGASPSSGPRASRRFPASPGRRPSSSCPRRPTHRCWAPSPRPRKGLCCLLDRRCDALRPRGGVAVDAFGGLGGRGLVGGGEEPPPAGEAAGPGRSRRRPGPLRNHGHERSVGQMGQATIAMSVVLRKFLVTRAEPCSASTIGVLRALATVAYDKLWRFDMQALPADLVRRGMVEEDPNAEHGLRLTIQDYPFANDGLLIWDAIKGWVQAYVVRFYPDAGSVVGNTELQAFWTEVRTVGHGDKHDAAWWPELDSPASLAHALATIVWVASAQHAAVNFGQYDYGGYFPNRPSIARTGMPVEEPLDAGALAAFLDRPDQVLRECFLSLVQVTLVMGNLDLLSGHSPDEEYLGGMETAPWNDDATVQEGYRWFGARLKAIERIIDERNKDKRLKNRCGAGIMEY